MPRESIIEEMQGAGLRRNQIPARYYRLPTVHDRCGTFDRESKSPYWSDISSLAGPSWGTYDSRATLDFLVVIASRRDVADSGRGAGESVRRRSARVQNNSASACLQAPSNVGLKGRKLAQTLSRSNSLFSSDLDFAKTQGSG